MQYPLSGLTRRVLSMRHAMQIMTRSKLRAMLIKHVLLAVLVFFVRGTNFVVIKFRLATLPPLLFAALRFAFSALPWMLWIPRPPVPWPLLVVFGVLVSHVGATLTVEELTLIVLTAVLLVVVLMMGARWATAPVRVQTP
jgi:drug/metabolite transporter (DMT)-like permease